jgi:hypothetical protein
MQISHIKSHIAGQQIEMCTIKIKNVKIFEGHNDFDEFHFHYLFGRSNRQQINLFGRLIYFLSQQIYMVESDLNLNSNLKFPNLTRQVEKKWSI